MYTSRLFRMCNRDLQRFGCLSWWLLFRVLPTLVVTAFSLLLLSASQARAYGALDEVQSGKLLLRAEGGDWSPAVGQSTEVEIRVAGMLASVSMTQAFRNESEHWVEGVYAFPLAENAAVNRMMMQVGERRIVGEIREREQARQIYREAKAAGKRTSLVEQQRPNLFTNRVANIGPGEIVEVRLEYVQPVEYSSGQFSLRLPTTLTARYIPGISAPVEAQPEGETIDLLPGLGWALPTLQVQDADLITPLQFPQPGSERQPLNPLRISAELDTGMPLAQVQSPYHEIALSRRSNVYRVDLAAGVTEMDRDFVLQWQPVSENAPSAAFFTELVDGDYYGLLMLVPPSPGRTPTPAPREIVFVVDTSGSMGGVSIRQARESLGRALQHLRPEDSFNIVQFNSTHHSLFRRAMPANRHNLQLAAEYVRHLQASGGTEMLPALRASLTGSAAEDELSAGHNLRQVVFITDGAVGNELQLFEEIVRLVGPSRLFTVGIGSAPNSWFMRKAAEYGRGSFTYIGDVAEVGTRMDALFAQLAAPVATQLSVDWPDGAEAWPARVPDLYQGEPLLVAVKLGPQLPDADLLVRGNVGGQSWSKTLRFFPGDDPEKKPSSAGVGSHWARKKIAGLLDMKVYGKDEQWVRAQVLPLALRHSLLSPYTSFVALEQRPSRPGNAGTETLPLANTRPRGQSAQRFAYPNTATTAAGKLWLGGLLLLLALFAHAFRETGDED